MLALILAVILCFTAYNTCVHTIHSSRGVLFWRACFASINQTLARLSSAPFEKGFHASAKIYQEPLKNPFRSTKFLHQIWSGPRISLGTFFLYTSPSVFTTLARYFRIWLFAMDFFRSCDIIFDFFRLSIISQIYVIVDTISVGERSSNNQHSSH